VVLALAATLLGGCQSLFGARIGKFEPRSPVVPQAWGPVGSPAAALADGRRQLATGQYGLAISRFREAAVKADNAAAAHNGLGVAYAQLGRADLARRYFLAAIAEAPSDPRYVANLERLVASTRIVAAEASPSPLSPRARLPAGVRLVEVGTDAQLVRMSSREVRLETPPAPNALGSSVADSGERSRLRRRS
jgi:tetratricopeptide (TPR) repeat protein